MSTKITADEIVIVKMSLERGYMITHDPIRKLVEENERLSNRLQLAEHALASGHVNFVHEPKVYVKCVCLDPDRFFAWYKQCAKEDGV